MLNLGIIKPGRTLRIPFSTFDKDDGSTITMTNYAVADILIYKDGGTTERASTAGFTATTDFDSKTGKHLLIIDLADNTTAAFFAAGSEYIIGIDAVTVDAVVVGGWVARFTIGYPGSILDTTIATLSSQTSFTLTSGPAEDDALNGTWAIIHDVASAIQTAIVQILDYTGSTKTITLVAGGTFTAAATDNISVMGLMPLQPTVLGRTVDVTATGGVGIDWANVENPTTTLGLTNTTVGIVTLNTTTTTLTNLPAITANWLTAAGTAADFSTEIRTAINGGDWALSTNASGMIRIADGTATGEIDTVSGGIAHVVLTDTSSVNTDIIARITGTGAVTFASLTVAGATTYTGNMVLSDGLTISAPSTLNRAGLSITGNGTGAAVLATGGATGPGLSIVGGPTSGDGVLVATTSGHGLSLTATGTSKHGAIITGGSAGTSDGLKIAAGTGGVGVRLDTLRASGTVIFQDALTVSGTTSLAALTASGTVTLNDLAASAVTFGSLSISGALTAGSNAVPWNAAWDAEVQSEAQDAITASGLSTLTAAQVWANGTRTLSSLGFTLGASDLATDTITAAKVAADVWTEGRTAINGGDWALSTNSSGMIRIADGTASGEIDTVSGGIAHVVLTDVLTTYTSNTPQSGDAFSRIGATGSGLTSLPAMIWDLADGIETGITPRQATRANSAILAGIISGAGTGTEVFKGIGLASGGTTRVTVTVNASGDRSALALNL